MVSLHAGGSFSPGGGDGRGVLEGIAPARRRGRRIDRVRRGERWRWRTRRDYVATQTSTVVELYGSWRDRLTASRHFEVTIYYVCWL
jgi:hypothetical protein